jgi:hypothetical protein
MPRVLIAVLTAAILGIFATPASAYVITHTPRTPMPVTLKTTSYDTTVYQGPNAEVVAWWEAFDHYATTRGGGIDDDDDFGTAWTTELAPNKWEIGVYWYNLVTRGYCNYVYEVEYGGPMIGAWATSKHAPACGTF